jgi:hypothetical protein
MYIMVAIPSPVAMKIVFGQFLRALGRSPKRSNHACSRGYAQFDARLSEMAGANAVRKGIVA